MDKISQTEFERLVRLQKEIGSEGGLNDIVQKDLTDIQFTEKDLGCITIVESQINCIQFDNSYEMYGMYWVGNSVKNTKFINVPVNKSEFWACNFDSCAFTDMTFFRVDFIKTEFQNCTFMRVDFSNSLLSNVKFKKCTFIATKFEEFELAETCRDISFSDDSKVIS